LIDDKVGSAPVHLKGFQKQYKVRVYDLSKELNLDNKDIITICDQLGIAVKSHSSTMTEGEAVMVRAAARTYHPYVMKSDPVRPVLPSRKQQILAIRRSSAGNSSVDSTSKENSQRESVLPSARPILQNQENSSIYVGNLSFKVTEEDLRSIFSDYGKVIRITLPTDRETGRLRGFAFIQMATEAEANLAAAELDEAEWMGREMKVSKAKPRERRPG
jgi:RNA recognition motif. (a.k.a. RRM, RBD, or RNP domain)/Translation initiation factor IF-2, N-terminal region